MKFFRDVVSHLIKNAFEAHTQFSVADDTAVGDNPVRSISLDATPASETDTIILLSWEGGNKIFEKTLPEQEAAHQFDLISTDLAEVASLTKQGQYDAAKDLMKKLGQKYAENTGAIVPTNLPKLHNTQASQEVEARVRKCKECGADLVMDEAHSGPWGTMWACPNHGMVSAIDIVYASEDINLMKKAKITMQNLWFSTTDELLDYQKKQKGAQPGADKNVPLWDQNKKKAPPADTDLAPASLSYEDAEREQEKDHEDIQKHIDEKIKTELESALQEKAASVFGPDQIELIKVLRKNGRNWDEIKKILVKDFGFDKDSTNIFVDEQRQSLDPAGIDVKPEEKEDKKPLTPPENLVSPETHDKLLQDHEDKKKDNAPLKEPSFTPKDVMDIPEDEEIQDQSALYANEIARADNDDIHKVAAPSDTNPLQEPLKEAPTTPNQDTIPMGKSKDHNAPQHGDRVFVSSDLTGEKAGFEATFLSTFQSKGTEYSIVQTDDGDMLEVESHRVSKTAPASGPQDSEPIAEPIIEKPKDEAIPVAPKQSDFVTSSKKRADLGIFSPIFYNKSMDEINKQIAWLNANWVEGTTLFEDAAPDASQFNWHVVPDTEVSAVSEEHNVLDFPPVAFSQKAQYIANILEMAENGSFDLEGNKKSAAKRKCDICGEPTHKADAELCSACEEGMKEASLIKTEIEKLASLVKDADDEQLTMWDERSYDEKYPMMAKYPEIADKVVNLIKEHGDNWFKVEQKMFYESPFYMMNLSKEVGSREGAQLIREAYDWLKEHESGNDKVWVPRTYEEIESSLKEASRVHMHECTKGHAQSCEDRLCQNPEKKVPASECSKCQSNKKASDFEKGISQDKTAAPPDPTEAPKTQFKDYKITPKYTPKEQAIPAGPELEQVLSKMDVLQQNLATLATAREQIAAKLQAEMKKIDDEGQRAQLEAELQETIEKAGVLVNAVESKVVQWKDKLYTLQTEEIQYVPKLTQKELLAKIYDKFTGAEKFVKDVLNGMLSQAKSVTEKTLVRWPNKKSSIETEASIFDELNKYNEELLAALQLLSAPIQ